MSRPAPYAVLLAAGAGSRFGGAKLLAPFQGRPLVAHAAATLAEAMYAGTLAGGVAVVPPEATALAWPLDTAGLLLVENPAPGLGLASSLQLGLAALERMEPRVEAALIVLADQPLLRLETIARLVAAWRSRGLSVRPRYSAQPSAPGHPVLLDRSIWPLARTLAGDTGLGPLLAADPDLILTIDLPGANPDVDLPNDLDSLEDS